MKALESAVATGVMEAGDIWKGNEGAVPVVEAWNLAPVQLRKIGAPVK
jgi:hypothetical protein